MSDLDNMKIAEAMNYVDPDYITEYESLSSFMMTRRIQRRHRIRIATRVAACVAIVSTGVFLTVKDINNGLIGNSRQTEMQTNFNKYGVVSEDKDNGNEPANNTTDQAEYNSAAGQATVLCESIQTEAPEKEILVSVLRADNYSMTLCFEFDEESRSRWYTGPGVAVTWIDTGDVLFNNYGDAMDYRISSDDNEPAYFTYRWSGWFENAHNGRFLVTSHISDGNVTYEVNTILVLKKAQ